jgi:hypothetical protein
MAKAIAAAVASTLAAANLTGTEPQETGGVATLVKPAKSRKVKQPKGTKPKGKSAKEKAEIAEVDEAQIVVLDNIRKLGLNVRDKSVKPADRKVAVAAAIAVMIGVGLGQKSLGYGPIVRAVLTRLLGGLLGIKVVGRDKISAKDVLKVLEMPKFAEQASAALTTYLAGLKADASENTLTSRGKNAERAKAWITGGLNEVYATSLKVVMSLGGQVNFTGDKGTISMPLDRALGVAFGRSITAAELAKAPEKSVTK